MTMRLKVQCPTCKEYGDLVQAKVRGTTRLVVVCTECDSLWERLDAEKLGEITDVESYLKGLDLPQTWDSLEIIGRLPQA